MNLVQDATHVLATWCNERRDVVGFSRQEVDCIGALTDHEFDEMQTRLVSEHQIYTIQVSPDTFFIYNPSDVNISEKFIVSAAIH